MASRALTVEIVGDASSLSKAFGRVEKDATRTEGRLKKFGAGVAKGFAFAGAAAGATAIGGLKKAADAAIEAEKTQARLEAQLRASGISFAKHKTEIDRVIESHSKLSGLDDEDLTDAFTNIVRVTGDVDKSLRLTGLAADIARAKHIDVAKAGDVAGTRASSAGTASRSRRARPRSRRWRPFSASSPGRLRRTGRPRLVRWTARVSRRRTSARSSGPSSRRSSRRARRRSSG
jgi:hypothetical protein